MNKLAILFQEAETSQMDLTHPEKGNPGVGGTAFCFMQVIDYLEKDPEIDLYVYRLQDVKLPCAQSFYVRDEEEAFEAIRKEDIKVVLMRNHQTPEVYDLCRKQPFYFLFWMHNRLTYEEIRMFRIEENVRRVIAVCREMYDYYIDDPIIEKMDYVINPFVPPSSDLVRKEEEIQKTGEKWVTFMGSLVPDKNFHYLSDIWKNIVRQVPEARLHVIGTGRLYEPDKVMGKYGLAQEDYEERILKGITDENGKILDTVVFHGILGEEKYDVFKNTYAGVANPMATETFCLVAIEMESCGVPVISRRKNGLVDTVRDKETGLLYSRMEDLEKTLLLLLTDEDMNRRFSEAAADFARTAFLPEKVLARWPQIIKEVANETGASYRKPEGNWDNNGKRVRAIFHALRKIPGCKKIPSVHDLQKK